MSLTFEWDPIKEAHNAKKHTVTFQEASTVFSDFHSVTVFDPDHSRDEDRYLIIGVSQRNRLLIVAFAERPSAIRIISARTLTSREREQYEQAQD